MRLRRVRYGVPGTLGDCLYWEIGRGILARQKEHGWGSRVIDRLAADLRRAFPEAEGFSPRNLKYMRAFAQAWPDEQIVQGPLAQITWYHNLTLLEKVKGREERLWYAAKANQPTRDRDSSAETSEGYSCPGWGGHSAGATLVVSNGGSGHETCGRRSHFQNFFPPPHRFSISVRVGTYTRSPGRSL